MKEKKRILEQLLPVAVLQALTPEAAEAVPQALLTEGVVAIRKLPFRIGRESRVQTVRGKVERIERPKMDDREPNNDLYLIDRGQLLNISREHLQIEADRQHGYRLVDRGSACGTKINRATIGGGDSGGSHPLADGDEIIIGTMESPYRYRFVDLSGFEIGETLVAD